MPPPGQANTLSSTAPIVKATAKGCLKTPGGLHTYYADAINAAQNALAAEQTARGGTSANPNLGGQNVIVLLSDGSASSTSAQMGPPETAQSTYECGQAVVATQNAATAGTKVIVVYYDDDSETCSDTATAPGLASQEIGTITSSCTATKLIANAPAKTANGNPTFAQDPALFYSTDSNSGFCPSPGNPNYTSINAIFKQIVENLTNARLVPVGTD